MLLEIASARPRAVFVDYLFLDLEEDTDLLFQTLEEIAEEVTVVLVSPFSPQQPIADERLAALYRDAFAHPNIVGADARVAADGPGGAALPLAGPDSGGRVPGPALAVAQAHRADLQLERLQRGDEARTVELVWPAPAEDCPDSRCAGRLIALSRGARAIASSMFPAFINRGELVSETAYPYPTYSATQIRRMPAELRSDLAGDVVFVGGWFAGVDDYVTTIGYGELPGVFAHAALFDNLVSYDRPYTGELPFSLGQSAYEVILILWLALMVLGQRLAARHIFAVMPLWRWGGLPDHACVIGASIAYNLVETTAFRTTPEHWFIAPSLLSFSLVGYSVWFRFTGDANA